MNLKKSKKIKMGKYLSIPNVFKESDEGSGPDFKWGLSAMQGWRAFMEDAFIYEPTFGHLKTFSLFLVLDGFGGNKFSNQVSRDLSQMILNQDIFKNLKDDTEYDAYELAEALKQSLYNMDDKMREFPEIDTCGCTVSGVLITPQHFFMVNLGDSRTILCREKRIMFETYDHLPWRYEERKRIEAAGGCIKGSRVNGMNISRALGNFPLKNDNRKQKVSQIFSPEAEVNIIKRTEKDDFIAIATDGIFNKLSNDDLINYMVKRIPYKKHLKELAEDILDYCLHMNSKDNLTVMVIHFNQSVITQEDDKISHDEQLDGKIRKLTNDFVDKEFADGKCCYGWEICFREMNKLHNDLFCDVSNTQSYGISLKKGVIYDEFKKLTQAIRTKRRAECLKKMQEQEAKKMKTSF